MRSYLKFPLKSKVARDRERFNLDLPVTSLRDKGTRLLIVANRVPEEDIGSGTLFENSTAGGALREIILYADEQTGGKLGEFAFINFHEFRVHDMDPAQRAAAEADFTLRIEKFIKKFKPDVIVAMGEDVARYMLDIDNPKEWFGRVKKYPGNKEIKFVYTLGVWDFCPDVPFEKRKEEAKKLQLLASLSGIISKHMEYAIRKRNLFTMDKSDFEIVTVDTYKKFLRMMRAIDDAPLVAIDSETESLAAITNKLVTLQLAPNDKIAYIIPFHHPQAKWSPSQIRKVRARLKSYFENGPTPKKLGKLHTKQFGTRQLHLYQNGKFDIKVFRNEFGLRHYGWEIYDVSAGEYALEENLKILGDKQIKINGIANTAKDKKYKPYALDYICLRYGWAPYKDAGVDKNSRKGFAEMSLDKFEKYAATDVIVLFRLMACQIARANHEGFDQSRFLDVVTIVLGSMSIVFADMEFNGHKVDTEYLLSVLRPGGKFQNTIKELGTKFRDSKAAIRVNKRMLRQSGAPKQTLFGGKPWEFQINKPDHQQKLFIEELGLEPLAYGKSGAASIGKQFIQKYGREFLDDDKTINDPNYVKEVGWFGDLKKSKTLRSNFLVPFWDRWVTEPDMKKDGRLRASYNYLYIITGRSGSSDPNFQNIPSHGQLAKLVKRCFIAEDGRMYIKVDYSAHEVRNWANVSGDEVMSGRFKESLRLKRNFILTDRESAKFERVVEALKTKGDIHIQNVKFFFGKWVDKKHPLRQKIKVVVFGVIYGKGPFSLAIDLNSTEDEAQELIDKLFSTFQTGGDWLKDTIALGRKDYIIETRFGIKRHLWGHMVPDNGVAGSMDRRGPNSAIQGPSSQMGYIAGRQLQHMKWKYFYSRDMPLVLTQNNMVHDSNEAESAIAHIPISLYLMEHALTTQVAKVCRDTFDWNLGVDLDCEFELGGSLADLHGWSQRPDELPGVMDKAFKYMKDELKRDVPKSELKKFEHNHGIMSKLRLSEIRKDVKAEKYPSTRMNLKPEIVDELKL